MLLDHTTFLVKEHVAIVKLTDYYDIFDPNTGKQIGFAKEVVPTWIQLLRLVCNRQFLPTTVVVKEDESSDPVVKISRGFSFFYSQVTVIDGNETAVGFFRSKIFTIGGGFTVHKASGEQVADVKGNWIGWDFKLLDMNGNELGRVNKKWAGALKEMFTSADNYVISLDESIERNPGLALLLLAAGLAIDTVYKSDRK